MHARRERGFTLVEVLVALLILSVLTAMAWQGIDGMSRARAASQQQMERTTRLNTVIAQWEQDLLSVYDTAAVPSLAFDGATLRMARVAEGGVRIVAWSLRGTRLQRWAGPVVTRVAELQDSWLRSQQLVGNESALLTLLEEVDGFRLEFFRNNGWSNPQSTGDVAVPGSGAPGSGPAAAPVEQLPGGVRLVLGLGGHTLIRDIVLAPQSP